MYLDINTRSPPSFLSRRGQRRTQFKMSAPTVANLDTCLRDLTNWQDFGIHLPGIYPSDITIIENDKARDMINQRIALYQKWLSVCPTASWRNVVIALEKIREMTIAESVRDKYDINTTQDSSEPTKVT